MSLKIFSQIAGGGQKLAESVGEAFDKNFTTQEERMEAKTKLINEINSLLEKIADYQAKVIQTEATGSVLQRNWRPVVMLSFALIVVYSYFIQPAFFPKMPYISRILPEDFWELLKIGLGGYVIGRSAEKIAESVGTNITFTKKK